MHRRQHRYHRAHRKWSLVMGGWIFSEPVFRAPRVEPDVDRSNTVDDLACQPPMQDPTTLVVVPAARRDVDVLRGAHTAHHGGFVVSAVPPRSLAVGEADRGRQTAPLPDLPPRGDLVLQLSTEGGQDRGVALDLGNTGHAESGYADNLPAKPGAHSRLEAVARTGTHRLVHAARPR